MSKKRALEETPDDTSDLVHHTPVFLAKRPLLDYECTQTKPPTTMNAGTKAFLDHLEPLCKWFPSSEYLCDLLQTSGSAVSGSWPLYFCSRPWPLHQRTESEICSLLICLKRLGVALPIDTFLRPLAMLLQWAPFAADFAANVLDIDVFCGWDPRTLSDCAVSSLDFTETSDNYFWEREPVTILETQPESVRLQFIIYPKPFGLINNFDFDFCRVWFDGSGLHRGYCGNREGLFNRADPDSLAMTGLMVDVFQRQWRSWDRLQRGVHKGSSEIVETLDTAKHRLLARMASRIEKYDRRRFTIYNLRGALGWMEAPLRWTDHELLTTPHLRWPHQ